ncbi:MAG: BlaI/MecI/CopY family transcriptional regulator [Steroidobacteraceae bacterium]
MSAQPQISDAEWQVMKVLWEHSPITSNELCERLTGARQGPAKQWHPKTIRTMLTRLARKQAVGTKVKDGVYHYLALVSREDCTRHAAHSFLDRVFDGALTPMVAHLVARRALSDEEKRELKKLLGTPVAKGKKT